MPEIPGIQATLRNLVEAERQAGLLVAEAERRAQETLQAACRQAEQQGEASRREAEGRARKTLEQAKTEAEADVERQMEGMQQKLDVLHNQSQAGFEKAVQQVLAWITAEGT